MNKNVNTTIPKACLDSFILESPYAANDPNIKISGMKALITMPINIDQIQIINLLKQQIQSKDGLVRATAIDILGDVSWAARFCQFYQTKQSVKTESKRLG